MSEKKATRVAYGEALVELGKTNEKIVVLDADLASATMTKYFKDAYPDRPFRVRHRRGRPGGPERGHEHDGPTPFCSTFAVFAGRCLSRCAIPYATRTTT
jgi:transketolase